MITPTLKSTYAERVPPSVTYVTPTPWIQTLLYSRVTFAMKNLPRVALQTKENFPVPRRLYKILTIVVKQKCLAIFGFLSNINAFKQLIVFYV